MEVALDAAAGVVRGGDDHARGKRPARRAWRVRDRRREELGEPGESLLGCPRDRPSRADPTTMSPKAGRRRRSVRPPPFNPHELCGLGGGAGRVGVLPRRTPTGGRGRRHHPCPARSGDRPAPLLRGTPPGDQRRRVVRFVPRDDARRAITTPPPPPRRRSRIRSSGERRAPRASPPGAGRPAHSRARERALPRRRARRGCRRWRSPSQAAR